MKLLPHYRGPMPRDIPEAFGWSAPYWCERCRGLEHEPATVQTQRRKLDQEAVDEYVCPHCGGTDVYETETPAPIKAIRRRRIHPNHSMEIAA